MTRVRFLRTKRFPHPDGPKRRPGEEHLVPAAVAEAWTAAGIVEVVETSSPAAASEPNPAQAKPTGKPRSKRQT